MLQRIIKGYNKKNITVILLFSIVLTSAGMFSTTARAIDGDSSIEENFIKAYSVYYEGHNIGIVEKHEDIELISEDIRQDYETKFNMKTILIQDIDFDEIFVGRQFLSHKDSLEKVLRANAEPKVESAVLKVDNVEIGKLKDEGQIQRMLDSIKEPYKRICEESGGKIETVDFEEEVVVTTSYIDYEELEDSEMVLNRCIEEQEEKQVYSVLEGDNVWIIADKHNITVWELLDANIPLEESDILQIGQELNLNIPEMLVNVLTVELIEYTESIAYDTEKKETDSLYTDQTKVSQEGQKGELKVEAKVHKRNAIEKDREIVSETVIKEPVKEILLQGTKKRITKTSSSRGNSSSGTGSGKGSGSMRWPASGRLSSGFGQRWGRLHAGIDIAAPTGTPIYAADGGTVNYSAFNSGGYGNLIKISHGGGITTSYAHMSSRVASKGNKVSKGQLIGYVGSTGRSTGPHLHFEVRVNGSRKNPINYLN
ncbi:MAG TPA: peptidoglycan DD-metalloendopeptidase family protein [Clostridia bacterium]|nr:peptidoglycan DD-metalloendopeptidase family protein [Clostridia bacterium]